MFGFLVGTLSLVGLGYVLTHDHDGHPLHGRGRRALLRRLFVALDTSPGQEKVLREVLAELEERFAVHRRAVRRGRQELARILGAAVLDDAAFAALQAEQATEFAATRDAVVAGLRRLHEALDERQRERLGRWMASGHGFARRCRRSWSHACEDVQ
jgi:hypothetical protein